MLDDNASAATLEVMRELTVEDGPLGVRQRRLVAPVEPAFGQHAPYGTTKYGVVGLSLALRSAAAEYGVHVSALCPGFIDTPLNDMLPHRPFLISAAKGARLMADKTERRAKSAMIPAWPWALVKWVLRLVPDRVMAGM